MILTLEINQSGQGESGHYSSHVSCSLYGFSLPDMTSWFDLNILTASHSFPSAHGENIRTPNEVGICTETSQDALHPIWEVKVINIFARSYMDFCPSSPTLTTNHRVSKGLLRSTPVVQPHFFKTQGKIGCMMVKNSHIT